jgi:hypothetical protein
MTRAELLSNLSKLQEAACAKGLRLDARIGDAATEPEIARLEAALNVILPRPHRELLGQWNGCEVEIREPPGPGVLRGSLQAQWVVLDIDNIIAATDVVRQEMARAMAGSDVADQVAETMSRTVVIVSQDDICIFFACGDKELEELPVRCMNLEYALGEFPPTMQLIATSPDDYFEKCFAQLAKTLETEIYWW